MPVKVVDMFNADRSAEYPISASKRARMMKRVFSVQQEPELLQTLVPEQLKAAKDFARKRRVKF